jgi:predicted nucleic acid-binding protein
VSFAQIVDCPLITADKKLYQTIKEFPGILYISEYLPKMR